MVFYGIRLFDLTTKMNAVTLKCFLQHHSTNTSLIVTLPAILNNLQLELGVKDCLLMNNYDTYEHLIIPFWTKLLCEKMDKLDINLNLNYSSISAP